VKIVVNRAAKDGNFRESTMNQKRFGVSVINSLSALTFLSLELRKRFDLSGRFDFFGQPYVQPIPLNRNGKL